MTTLEWIKDNWELVLGIVGIAFGGPGIVSWVFRWFENRGAKEETVAKRAMDYIALLADRVTNLERNDVEKSTRIDQLERELDLMEEWVRVLIGQLEAAGIPPKPKPGSKTEGNNRPSKGFRP